MSLVERPPSATAEIRALDALVENKTVQQLTDELALVRHTEGARVARAAKQFYTASGIALVLIGLGFAVQMSFLVMAGLVTFITISFFLIRLMFIEFERQSRISLYENAIKARERLEK